MAEEGFKRKLTSIFSADVVGYSRLMEDDEAATVTTLTSYREVISTLIKQHNGMVVDSPGDNLLAEFVSVVDAVQCAVSVQNEISARNEDLPEHRKMQFRIGINLGDVIQEEERIYGDGVNIAARLEALADPGGICISKTAFDQIEKKLPYGYEFIGDQTVKNISKPVGAYRLVLEPRVTVAGEREKEKRTPVRRMPIFIGIAAVIVLAVVIGIWQFYVRSPSVEPASVDQMAHPLPEKPSIAVLAFDNLTGDPSQEYFSDGISEQIITVLSNVGELFVISRNSSFSYKGKPVKVQQVSEELGVRYVLEGSVRRSGDRLRITAQLIDAIKGQHLWAENYDRELKDIFEIQDEITMKIVTSLRVKLTSGEQARILEKQVKNPDVYLKYLKWASLMNNGSKESIIRSGQLAQEIIDTEPEYAIGYSSLGWYHWFLAERGISPPENLKKAFELAQKTLSKDESDASAHAILGQYYLLSRKYEKAIASGKRSVDIQPNGALFHQLLGSTLSYAGRVDEAIAHIKQAIRLDPLPAYYYYYNLGRCYFQKGQYEDALAEYKKALQRAPNVVGIHFSLACAYALLDREEEARASAAKALELAPGFSISEYSQKTSLHKDQAYTKLTVDALRKAGFPEHPPLPLPDKPSIAVLAFDNLSGDPEQEYFSDGIAENIITVLSKVGELFVIARNSSFTYKGKPVKVQQVSKELGVKYVLEGSVQKSGDRVRISAQLIDAIDGQHLWAEKYDRDFKDIFEIQDDITVKIVNALRIKLTEGERARLSKSTKNPDVFLKGLEMNSLVNAGTKESLMRFGQLAQEVIDIEPESSLGYTQLGWYHKFLANRGISPRENIKKAFMLAQKALSMDEADSFAHTLMGSIYVLMRKYEEAISSGKRSVELQPNDALAHMFLGSSLNNAGRVDEAIAHCKQAIRLNPFPAYYYYHHLGLCYLQNGQYEDALAEFKKALQRAPNAIFNHITLAVNYSLAGREDEARASAAKALELEPKLSVKSVSKMLLYKNEAYKKLLLDGFRKAGFPE
jgi:adenylate cyclase